jgi:pyruvate formate lyase activating enzyme
LSDNKIDEILAFLDENKEKYGAVVISGGEPTMHKDLPEVMKKIKSLDLQVRLETNGTNPKILSQIVSEGLVDYVAMDIKAPLEKEKYKNIAGVSISTSQLGKINKSIRILTRSKVEYEVRTTLIKQKHSFHDILDICNTIVGCKRYCLQEFDADIAYDKTYNTFSGYDQKELERLIKAINPEIKEVVFK